MSVSEDFVEYVLELLDPVSDIKTSKMFGGVLLKVQDRQLGVLIMDTLYFKVTDSKLQERYKEEGSRQFEYTRKDPMASGGAGKKERTVVIKNWWSVPESAMDSSEEIVRLAEEVLDQSN